MTDGIKKAIEVEKSEMDELYFVSISEDDIDYIPQLKILSDEADAPIMVATSNYSEEKHHMALINGADLYGGYCETPELSMNMVIASINTIDRWLKKKKPLSDVVIYNGILLATSYRNSIFVNEREVVLYKIEFDILYYLITHRGKTISYEQIYKYAWRGIYDYTAKNALWASMGRLRDKLNTASGGIDFIENVRDIGYRFRLVAQSPNVLSNHK
jgi:DNA-binding response OmpR family regulator